MGDQRRFAKHVKWTESEMDLVRAHYPTAPRGELMRHFPGRTARQVQCKADAMGIMRALHTPLGPDEIAKRKREAMGLRRRTHPERVKEIARATYARHKGKRNSEAKQYRGLHFFWARANKLDGVTATDLARIWKRQRGRCALSGVRLDRTAEIDHIISRARGGTDALANLQWLSRSVNQAKRDMEQFDFIAMCRAIAECA